LRITALVRQSGEQVIIFYSQMDRLLTLLDTAPAGTGLTL
jgi:hypothetical protein